jgi:hypothetical protein
VGVAWEERDPGVAEQQSAGAVVEDLVGLPVRVAVRVAASVELVKIRRAAAMASGPGAMMAVAVAGERP